MKNYYFAALFLIIILAVSFVGYGIYLNSQSNSYIATTQAHRKINVSGFLAEIREIYPEAFLGTISLGTEHMADAIAQIDGTITEITVEQGQEVGKDDVLARVENITLPYLESTATANIKKTEAAFYQAKSNFERAENLREKNIIPQSEIDAANAQLAAAEAELTSARVAMVQVEQAEKYQTIQSPIRGDVLFIYQKDGNFVAKGTPVLMVGDFTTLMCHLFLPAEKLAKHALHEADYELVIDLEDDLRAFDTNFNSGYDLDEVFPVEFTAITPPMNEPAVYRQLTLKIDNSKKILEPGLYTNAILRKRTSIKTLVVPIDAFTSDEDKDIDSVDEDGRLKTIDVTTGVTDGKYIEILEGLEPGDVVITSNVTDLEDGTAIVVMLE